MAERPALNVVRIAHGDHVIEKVYDLNKLLIVCRSTPPPKAKEMAEIVVSVYRTRPTVEIDWLRSDETGMRASYECYDVVKSEHEKLLGYALEVARESELAFFLEDVRSRGYPCISWSIMPPLANADLIIEKLLYTAEPTFALHTEVEKEEVGELGVFKAAADGYVTVRYSQAEEAFELRLYDEHEALLEVAYVKPEEARPVVEKLLDIAARMYAPEEE